MANLRDIRNRITSVNNTEQITKAMKMVAAAKLRKAQTRMTANRPYVAKMKGITGRLAAANTGSSQLLRKPKETKRVLFIVVGSDRGLCGGFNNNLFKEVEREIEARFDSFRSSGALDLLTIGRKAEAHFKKRNYQVVNSFPGFFDNLNFPDTASIMQQVIGQFTDGDYDAVYLAYNEFKSVIVQTRVISQLLPIIPEQLLADQPGDSVDQSDYIYEPDGEQILNYLLPVYLNVRLWSAVLESNASEQGARMAAMDNATENAKELKRDLKLQYNRARQSAITTEISEIVSGAQALEEQ
ncbi:MAG: ATP synthase F1 subunit gamma [Balneolaceae bacterium]